MLRCYTPVIIAFCPFFFSSFFHSRLYLFVSLLVWSVLPFLRFAICFCFCFVLFFCFASSSFLGFCLLLIVSFLLPWCPQWWSAYVCLFFVFRLCFTTEVFLPLQSYWSQSCDHGLHCTVSSCDTNNKHNNNSPQVVLGVSYDSTGWRPSYIITRSNLSSCYI